MAQEATITAREVSSDTQAVIDTARSGTQAQVIADVGTIRHVLIHGHGNHPSVIETIDLQSGLSAPIRKVGHLTVFDAASFNSVINGNKDAGDICVYIDRNPGRPSIVGVLNGNGANGPGWGDFRVAIELRPTPQWLKWKANDGKMMGQFDLGEFVEENLEDIVEPDAATMLEIVTQLQVTRATTFRSKVSLQSGTIGFQHDQDDKVGVGAGSIEVPQSFTLGIAPVYGLESYKIPARYRYRIEEGRLRLGYKLQRVETIMEHIVGDVVKGIDTEGLTVVEGLPPG